MSGARCQMVGWEGGFISGCAIHTYLHTHYNDISMGLKSF